MTGTTGKRTADDYRKYQMRENHHHWGGDKITTASGRARARRWYEISKCGICGSMGRDRHHIDQNTLNNDSNNIIILCRSCHKKLHLAHKKTLNCAICGNTEGPFRKKRCERCDSYFRHHHKERPIDLADTQARKGRAVEELKR